MQDKIERVEIFNFKDAEGQRKFKEMTNDSTKLSAVFDSKEPIDIQSKKFLKKLNKILHQCFKKIKIKKSYKTDIDKLFEEQKELKHKADKKSQNKLKQVETTLADKMEDDLFK